MTSDGTATFLLAAGAFVRLVERLPDDLTGPGLGAWDLRALVGHTSRSLITVSDYLQAPEPVETTFDSAAAYVAQLAEAARDDAGVVERGRAAGRALGADPAAAVRGLVDRVADDLAGADPDRVLGVYGGSIRLRDYLPTRTFELVVHGLDLARATGLPLAGTDDGTDDGIDDALAEAATLAAEVAVRRGEGAAFLSAVTGRDVPAYSVV